MRSAWAEWLSSHPEVESVNYQGLAHHPTHAAAKKYLTRNFGGVMSFVLKCDREPAPKFVDRLQLI